MVRLVPMTESEFQVYRKHSIETYAQEHITAGNWDSSDALQKSEKEFQQLLPDGVTSKKQHLLSIEDDRTSERIGLIWFAEKGEASRLSAFIYDFQIFEDHRRMGYGKQALEVLEEKVKELGIVAISLHVFGHNKIAINLYEAAGYEVTDMHMAKKLNK